MEYVHQYNQYSAFGKISDTHAIMGLQMSNDYYCYSLSNTEENNNTTIRGVQHFIFLYVWNGLCWYLKVHISKI